MFCRPLPRSPIPIPVAARRAMSGAADAAACNDGPFRWRFAAGWLRRRRRTLLIDLNRS